MSVLQDLYDGEINVEITSAWDLGWEVKIGDRLNGFIASDVFEKWDEVEPWIIETVIANLPASSFAGRYGRAGRHLRLIT